MKLNYAKIHTVKGDMAKGEINIALTTNWTDEAYLTSKRLGVFAGENERFAITFERVEDQLHLIPPDAADVPFPEHLSADHSIFCHICGQALNLQGPWEAGHELALRVFATDHAHADMAQAWIDDMARISVGAQHAAPTLSVVDRPAAIGDVVLLDSIGHVGDSVLMENLDWELLLRADDGGDMFPGFAAAIVGLCAGESLTFSLTLPADSFLPGRVALFDVTIKEVRSVSDDEPAPDADPAAVESAAVDEDLATEQIATATDEDLTPDREVATDHLEHILAMRAERNPELP